MNILDIRIGVHLVATVAYSNQVFYDREGLLGEFAVLSKFFTNVCPPMLLVFYGFGLDGSHARPI